MWPRQMLTIKDHFCTSGRRVRRGGAGQYSWLSTCLETYMPYMYIYLFFLQGITDVHPWGFMWSYILKPGYRREDSTGYICAHEHICVSGTCIFAHLQHKYSPMSFEWFSNLYKELLKTCIEKEDLRNGTAGVDCLSKSCQSLKYKLSGHVLTNAVWIRDRRKLLYMDILPPW